MGKLTLRRRKGEKVTLTDTDTGLTIRVIYVDQCRGQARICFEAPPRVKILREELDLTDPPPGS